jgi:broad specificity phosphatase PhoE
MLRDHLAGKRIAAIYSSDLNRARLTAEIVASVHPTEVVLCPELRELDLGEIEG